MSKYSQYRQPLPPKPTGQHPIWRGIGCVMMVIIPVLSYAIAVFIIESGVLTLPPWMRASIYLPDFVGRYLPPLARFLGPILGTPYFMGKLAITLFMIVLLAGLISMVYAIAYRIMGPSPYSAVDAPPPKVRVKRYKR